MFSRNSKPEHNSLVIPDAAKKDSKSFEVLRVWVANEGQHVTIRVDTWDNPAAWGIVLADLARHIANAYQQDAGADPNIVLQSIKSLFDAEMGSPTDLPSGRVFP